MDEQRQTIERAMIALTDLLDGVSRDQRAMVTLNCASRLLANARYHSTMMGDDMTSSQLMMLTHEIDQVAERAKSTSSQNTSACNG